MMPSLQDRFVQHVSELRALLKEYHLLPESEQKAVRHMIYNSHGKIGHLITPIFPAIAKEEEAHSGRLMSKAASASVTEGGMKPEPQDWAKPASVANPVPPGER